MLVPIRYNVRSLLVRKLTTIATALGIALVVFVAGASVMLEEGVKQAVATGGRTDNVIILRKGSDAELSSAIGQEYIALFTAQPQVSQAEGVVGEVVIVITAERNDGTGGISNLTVRGMTPNGFAFRPEFKIVSGRAPKPGTNEVVIGRAVAGKFLDPGGSKKTIDTGGSFDVKHNRPLDVVGVFSAGGSYDSEVWGDIDAVRRNAGREGVVSSARLRLRSADDFDAYRQAIEADPRFSMKVQREVDYYADQSQQISTFLGGMGTALAFLFSLAAMIGAAITMNAAVANRSREIGTLRALGFSSFSVLLSFLGEALMITLLGGAIGSAFVMLMSFVSFPMINFQTFSEIVIRFVPTGAVFVSAFKASLIMGLIGGMLPAIRAARVSPVEAMRA
jgi:putative ABC transport system permease protein